MTKNKKVNRVQLTRFTLKERNRSFFYCADYSACYRADYFLRSVCGRLSRYWSACSHILSLFLVISALLIFVQPAVAAQSNYDVRVLIDISGSMKKNDPKNLRRPALKLLTELLPSGTKAGVWTFGKYANMLVPLDEVDERWKHIAKPKADTISSVALWTNIGLAMGKASSGWVHPDSKKQRSMILLTDGMVDVSKKPGANEKARREILEKILPRLKKANVKIHTIALSRNADTKLLKQLALSTDGHFSVVNNSDQLIKAFVKAFDKSVEQDQLPIQGNSFEVDGSVEEFTLLVYHLPNSSPTKLMTPSQRLIKEEKHPENVAWFSTATFDLITVKGPQAGTWLLEAAFDADNRVTIVSDLRLKVDGFLNNVLKEEILNIDVSLIEGDHVLKRAEFLSLLDISFRQEYFKGNRVWEGMLTSYNNSKIKTPTDGIYEAKLSKTLLPGEHEFLVTIDGKTFKRQKKHRLNVLEGAVEVLVVEEPSQNYEGHSQYFLNLVPVPGVLKKNEAEIKVSIKDPTGQRRTTKAELTPFGTWRVDVLPDQGNGTYEAKVKVSGVTQTGRSFSIMQDPVEVVYEGLPVVQEVEPEMPTISFEPEEEKVEEPPAEEVEPEEPVVEPEEVEEEPEEEPMPELEEETVPEASPVSENLMIMGALVFANLILFGGIFFIYSRIIKKRANEDKMAEQQIAEAAEKRRELYKKIESGEDDDDDEDDDEEEKEASEDEEEEEVNEALENALDLDISIGDDDDNDEDDDNDFKLD